MQNDVCVAAEAFYSKPDDAKPLIGRYIDLLSSAMREFRQTMRDESPPAAPLAQA